MSEVAGDYREVYEVQVNEEEGPQAPKVDLRTSELEGANVTSEEGFQTDEVAEKKAQTLLRQKDFSWQACETLLMEASLPCKGAHTRSITGDPKASYGTFGAYSYGSQYGITKMTAQIFLTRYVNQFLRKHLRPKARWSSFTVSVNNFLPVHKDVNNHPEAPSYLLELGPYRGGELWVEGTSPEQPEATCPQARSRR